VALKAQPNILAVALPKLAAPPITPDKAKTLGALASVAGPALPPHLDSIIPRLLDAIEGETNLEEGDEIVWTKRESFDDVSKFPAFNALRSIITAAPEDCGAELLSEISDALTELAKTSSLKKVDEEKENAKSRRRAVSSIALADFAKTFSGYDDFVDAQVLVKTLTLQFSDKYKCARDAAWGALNVVVSTIQKDELMEFVDCCHASVRQCREQAKRLHKQKQISPGGESTETDSLSSLSPSKYTIIPALALPRALEAISKIYLAGVLYGEEPEHRQRAAEALQLAVSCSTKDGLKAHVVGIAGPLIRVVSDKFPSSVRAALLDCLATLVEKGGIGLKPFVPQLQTTFLKSLNDANRAPRMSSAKGLGLLMSIQVRVDPVAADLAKKLANNEVDGECIEAHFEAARGVARHGGSKITPESAEIALNASTAAALTSDDDNIRLASARCAAAYASLLYQDDSDGNNESKREDWLKKDVEQFASENITVASREGKAKILSEFARLAPDSILSSVKDKATTLNNLAKCASDDIKVVKSNCAKGLGYLGKSCVQIEGASSDTVAKILQVLTKLLRDSNGEVRENASKAIRSMIKCASLKNEIDDITVHFPIFLADLAEVAVADKHDLAKKSAERAVFRALRLDLGAEVALPHLKQGGTGAAARGRLSDLNLRKLASLPDDSEDDFDPEAEEEDLV
jgi:hypothetical protein